MEQLKRIFEGAQNSTKNVLENTYRDAGIQEAVCSFDEFVNLYVKAHECGIINMLDIDSISHPFKTFQKIFASNLIDALSDKVFESKNSQTPMIENDIIDLASKYFDDFGLLIDFSEISNNYYPECELDVVYALSADLCAEYVRSYKELMDRDKWLLKLSDALQNLRNNALKLDFNTGFIDFTVDKPFWFIDKYIDRIDITKFVRVAGIMRSDYYYVYDFTLVDTIVKRYKDKIDICSIEREVMYIIELELAHKQTQETPIPPPQYEVRINAICKSLVSLFSEEAKDLLTNMAKVK